MPKKKPLLARAKIVTLIIFLGLVVLCLISLILGIFFYSSDPYLVLNGIGKMAEIIYPYFLPISIGVAGTGIGVKVMESFRGVNSNTLQPGSESDTEGDETGEGEKDE